MPRTIYTIGHSTHPVEYFIGLLRTHEISCVVDVRSIAASRFNPQYNKKKLAASLEAHAILYLHFDKEFGARQTDPAVLNEGGQVDFEKVRASENFRSGVGRLKAGTDKGYRIALMCAEAEPLHCHRFFMVTPALAEEGFEVLHILKDHSLRTTEELEDELLKKYAKKLPKPDLYDQRPSREKLMTLLYRMKNKEMGFNAKG